MILFAYIIQNSLWNEKEIRLPTEQNKKLWNSKQSQLKEMVDKINFPL